MMILRAALLLLAGCATYETLANADGEVYECEAPSGDVVELCFFEDSAAELADLTGSISCGLSDRLWPVITNAFSRGCRYECPAPASGCNATSGCFCP